MTLGGLDAGYGAPFIKVFFGGIELTTQVEDFEYGYDEEGDDVCKLTFKFENREEADNPQWQEKAMLIVTWGFLGSQGFLEHESSQPRKVYIQQLKWEYGKDAITLKIDATEKAISMKYQDSQEVHKNISLLGLAQKIGDKHGLEVFLEQDSEKSPDYIAPTLPGEHLNKYLIKNREAVIGRNVNGIPDFPNQVGKSNINRVKLSGALTNTVDQLGSYKARKVKGSDLSPIPTAPEEKPLTKAQSDFLTNAPKDFSSYGKSLADKFNNYDNIPQANKTDKQLLDEMGKREKNGPYLIDTRDDSIIIKKRNFSQAPYKSYTYGGDEGSLLEFTPMSKNKSHKKSAMNVGFSGWNALDKTAFTGNANGVPDSDPSISRFRKVYQFYKGIDVAGKGLEIMEDQRNRRFSTNTKVGASGGTTDASGKFIPSMGQIYHSQVDNTGTGIKPAIITQYTVHDAVTAMEGSLTYAYNKLTNNSVYDPTSTNPQAGFDSANNLRRNKELSTSPATATIYGDPHLKTGVLITILAVSKKYSGNYYIMKANHKLTSKGYTVELELCTQGYNIAPNSDYIPIERVNKSIGSSHGKNLTKKIKTKTNP